VSVGTIRPLSSIDKVGTLIPVRDLFGDLPKLPGAAMLAQVTDRFQPRTS
jgi:hypothetical protein